MIEKIGHVSLYLLGVGYGVLVYSPQLDGFVTGSPFFRFGQNCPIRIVQSSSLLRRFRELLFQPYGKPRFLTVIEISSPHWLARRESEKGASVVTGRTRALYSSPSYLPLAYDFFSRILTMTELLVP